MSILTRIFFVAGIWCFMTLMSSCHDDREEYFAHLYGPPQQSFTEGFDTLSASYERGWRFINRSVDIGPSEWVNPASPPFAPYFSASIRNGFLWVDYNSTASPSGTISNWAVSPPITFKNNDSILFYTRAELYYYNGDSVDFANRLQVRLNKSNDGLDVGDGTSSGDFDELLLDINAQYRVFSYNAFISGDPDVRFAYPHKWTKFIIQITGLDQPVRGRFAFRYFLEGGGNNGRGSSVGIDQVTYISAN